MFKRIASALLLALAAQGVCAQNAWTKSAYNLVSKTYKDTYETKADSMTYSFVQTFMNKQKGVFNATYNQYAFNAYWQQAHYIDVVIYNYQRHKGVDTKNTSLFLNYIKLWYKNKGNNWEGTAAASSTTPNTSTGYKMFENGFIDDMCWVTLTMLHVAEATGTASYATVARQIFDNYIITEAREDETTGGLWLAQKQDAGKDAGVSACTQSPATLIAAKLYQRFGTEKYLEYAKKFYAYASKKMVKSDYRVEEPPLSYTQGTFAEACRILFHVTDEASSKKTSYKNMAYQYLNYAFTSSRCTSGGILRSEGTDGNQSLFKAVLIPYAVNFVLDDDMQTTYRTTILKLIMKNTTTLWPKMDFTRYPSKVFCNYIWSSPWSGEDSEASCGAMCSGASLIENTARMCRAITDRYTLGSLITECSKLTIEPGHADDADLTAYHKALAEAQEIMEAPGSYTTANFQKAIANLQEALPAAQDYATRIDNAGISEEENTAGIYTLDGRLVRSAWQGTAGLPRGIYVVGRRTVQVP